MHIERVGTGPDLVLVHGWAMHSGIFAPIVPALAERFTLHLVDLPGHGRSRDDDTPLRAGELVSHLLDNLPERSHWLGWSLGGLVALQLALDRPEAVDRLLLVSATPRFTRAEHWPDAVDGAVFDEFAADLATDYRATLQRFLALEVHGSDTAQSDLRRLRADVFSHGEPSRDALAQGLDLLRGTDLTQRLPDLDAPALFVGGRRDRLVPWRCLRRSAETAPDAGHLLLPGAGHAPFVSQPRGFAARVASFLNPMQRKVSGA